MYGIIPCRDRILFSGFFLILGLCPEANQGLGQEYVNRLLPMKSPTPLLADQPDFVEPLVSKVRFESTPLIEEKEGNLDVRAWRFSYNARGIIEFPNRLQASATAVIVVHPWGIDDGQGWKSPEPAGVALFCTPEKNQVYRAHVRKVVEPFVQSLRGQVGLIAYSLPGGEDPIRKKMYRSIRSRPGEDERKQGADELAAKLKSFSYKGQPIPSNLPLDPARPTSDYFRKFPGLDAGPRFNNQGFWNLPIPVVKDLKVHAEDVVIYDADGYSPLKKFLKDQKIRHVLLCGYATDMCVCSTTAGYQNLGPDFNVFVVGDATLATFPAADTPRFATQAALSKISLNHLVTQVSWIKVK